MIAVDTNLLVYAHRAESPFHAIASRLIAELAEGRAAWAIPWPCLHEFIAVVTNPRVYKPPTPRSVALAQTDAWLASPTVVPLAESAEHWPTLRALLAAGQITSGRVRDARIVALCTEHGVHELWSADRDFNRFASLLVINPLVTRD